MNSERNQLDADELFHLALQASQMGDHENAILMLKESIKKEPSAKNQYILAAEHAEIGMFERAAEEMLLATQMDGSLWTAHLQLGLLNMTLDKKEEAIKALKNLGNLDRSDALYMFGMGLISLMNDDLEKASDLIGNGLKANISNPALNESMEGIQSNIIYNIDQLSSKRGGHAEGGGKGPAVQDNTKSQGNKLLLDSYEMEEKDTH